MMDPLWTKLNLDNKEATPVLYRLSVNTDGYKLFLTDLVHLFYEEVQGEDNILQKCQHLNPVVEVTDATDLLLELSKIFDASDSNIKATFAENSETCTLSIKGHLFDCHFNWEFVCQRAPPKIFFEEITQPTLESLAHLHGTQKKLVALLKAKDQEIKDYEENGASLTRKSLKTKPFSQNILTDCQALEITEFVTSQEFSEICFLSSNSNGTEETKQPGPSGNSQSPVKTQRPSSNDIGKKRLVNPARNPIPSSKQAKVSDTSTQTQTRVSAVVKTRLKKL